ncbi:hydroxymethylglutaryl-CoA lyase [Denitratisoma sp. DHT3]|uniref:hydroxymethylglutaryl-CoA lyase n=1 Tax=Denitratisoma sp. DHT3 TaxID=1981880 RepID=UPI00119856E8|nr:hydroxymethylglutaryl-CoA lyase [Denitratisoma sp. DHT3]QDX79908.1 hydroxymethylglutaryl-CoA lyase [Denitratisoma sp. DHT3]
MVYPTQAIINEVGPRDGLQNEKTPIPAALKIELIERLAAAGLTSIEATSFVSPRWVPQLADGAEVLAGVPRRPGLRYTALVPNLKGFEAARAAGADEVAVFVAASESFSRKNTNCSIAEALERCAPVLAAAAEAGMPVRGYISCIAGCPFEGEVSPARVGRLAGELHAMGCHQISLGDTIGVGTPRQIRAAIKAAAVHVPVERLIGHYHDTYGMALANVHASLEMGVFRFDSSVAGLGGCPYAPGATGNVATEDLAYLMRGLGIETGINMNKLVAVARWISAKIDRPAQSALALAWREQG